MNRLINSPISLLIENKSGRDLEDVSIFGAHEVLYGNDFRIDGSWFDGNVMICSTEKDVSYRFVLHYISIFPCTIESIYIHCDNKNQLCEVFMIKNIDMQGNQTYFPVYPIASPHSNSLLIDNMLFKMGGRTSIIFNNLLKDSKLSIKIFPEGHRVAGRSINKSLYSKSMFKQRK
jgi:hypothetical protein